jgi:hypothetical protein
VAVGDGVESAWVNNGINLHGDCSYKSSAHPKPSGLGAQSVSVL